MPQKRTKKQPTLVAAHSFAHREGRECVDFALALLLAGAGWNHGSCLLETYFGSSSHRGLWWARLCVFGLADIESVSTAFFFAALSMRMTLSTSCFCFDLAALDMCPSSPGSALIFRSPRTYLFLMRIRCCGACLVGVLGIVRSSCVP